MAGGKRLRASRRICRGGGRAVAAAGRARRRRRSRRHVGAAVAARAATCGRRRGCRRRPRWRRADAHRRARRARARPPRQLSRRALHAAAKRCAGAARTRQRPAAQRRARPPLRAPRRATGGPARRAKAARRTWCGCAASARGRPARRAPAQLRLPQPARRRPAARGAPAGAFHQAKRSRRSAVAASPLARALSRGPEVGPAAVARQGRHTPRIRGGATGSPSLVPLPPEAPEHAGRGRRGVRAGVAASASGGGRCGERLAAHDPGSQAPAPARSPRGETQRLARPGLRDAQARQGPRHGGVVRVEGVEPGELVCRAFALARGDRRRGRVGVDGLQCPAIRERHPSGRIVGRLVGCAAGDVGSTARVEHHRVVEGHRRVAADRIQQRTEPRRGERRRHPVGSPARQHRGEHLAVAERRAGEEERTLVEEVGLQVGEDAVARVQRPLDQPASRGGRAPRPRRRRGRGSG